MPPATNLLLEAQVCRPGGQVCVLVVSLLPSVCPLDPSFRFAFTFLTLQAEFFPQMPDGPRCRMQAPC